MNAKFLVFSTFLVLSTVPAFVLAKGDIAAGETKASACSSCHGENGNSMVSSFPKLAGQHANYLVRQLQDLKDGFRKAPMMAPLAMGLDDQSIEDVAVYYASQKISTNLLPILENDDDEDDINNSAEDLSKQLNDLLALGKDLYANGNLKTTVSACIACHGPSADGNKPSSFPSLKSQHADYLIKTLTDFKKGSRQTMTDNMMHMIAKRMSDKEIQAVSYYISMIK